MAISISDRSIGPISRSLEPLTPSSNPRVNSVVCPARPEGLRGDPPLQDLAPLHRTVCGARGCGPCSRSWSSRWSPRLDRGLGTPKWPSAIFQSCGSSFGKIIYCWPWEQDLMLIHLGYGTYRSNPSTVQTWTCVLALDSNIWSTI
mgnify:CR=1 FL=1